MAIYWHPILTQLLRQFYGDRLEIQEEVNLGELPLRVDLVLIKRAPGVVLPYPFNHLGDVTLLSYKGPEDTASQVDLRQLEIYALLYQDRFNLPRRSDLTLWLVASKFARQLSQRDGAHLTRAQMVGAGVRTGKLDGFPTCLVNLNELPIEMATWPLVMVSRGPSERQLVRYFLEHQSELDHYWRQVERLHASSLLKEITMPELNHRLREGGFKDFNEYYEVLLKLTGSKQNLVKLLGEKEVAQALVDQVGVEEAQLLIQQAARKSSLSAGKLKKTHQ